MSGRPTKLTPELQEEILKVIRTGNYIETACAFVGINKSTLYDWMKRGARELDRVEKTPNAKIKKSEEKYVTFSNAIKKAMAHAEIRDVAIINEAAKTNWQASAWKLERRTPEKWGRKDRLTAEVEHSGGMNNKNENTVVDITNQFVEDEESKELLMQLWRRKIQMSNEDN